MTDIVVIPWQDLTDEALKGVVAEFVSRDGTDYGEQEVTEEQKMDQVLAGIKHNQYVVVFDPDLAAVHILTKEDWQAAQSSLGDDPPL